MTQTPASHTAAPTPVHWKLVIDCADPHAQADFWAAALAYTVEDHSALIERLLGLGAVPAELTVESHGRRAWRDLAAVRHPGDPYEEESGTGLGRRLLFQRVPEGSCSEEVTSIHTAARPQLGALLAQLGALGPSRTGVPGRGLAA